MSCLAPTRVSAADTLPRSVLYLLAAPSTPDGVRQEARSIAGEDRKGQGRPARGNLFPAGRGFSEPISAKPNVPSRDIRRRAARRGAGLRAGGRAGLPRDVTFSISREHTGREGRVRVKAEAA
jgi:hypothetical protein